ncbi:LLM class flavin-dependent oxidoreductase [Streptomyces sp. NBC_00878]|uniref:LLM class flavin-dependent oxidoreductase n=1 Tax=Streptomyces sp. NBC_00878 TaxID=2975854 RepID=UPI002258D098|nr:LLM class flavin-dependent oxidoreductase [Streptomyces sp. NBC_00878]MCX4911446.1 LLM class flavin-dependent oxidoreductase [Streptomyces sp. NBC_00878]
MATQFGVGMPTLAAAGNDFPLAESARRAEQLGFDSLWVVDHLIFHTGIVEPVTALATAAAVTEDIGLGFGVLQAAMRQPALLAKQLASLQLLSRDRIRLGVGVGGENPAEWAAAGVPPGTRGRRTDALLAALPGLLAGQAVRLGPPYDLDVPALAPAAKMPPVWIGGRGEPALNRAARYGDGWLGLFLDAARFDGRRSRLAELAEALGRPAPRVGITVFTAVDDRRPGPVKRSAGDFLAAVYGGSSPQIERYLIAGTSAEVADGLAEFRAAGADLVVLLPAATDYLDQYERLASIVVGNS